ncbi:MAG: GNAT family N-acetyltransferase [bacterium]
MSVTIERIDDPAKLPDEWDSLAANYWQRRLFLHHAHSYNPCQQRYYLLINDGIISAGAIVYTLRLDLLTYLAIPSPVAMQIVGIPCSVSASGIIGKIENQAMLLDKIMEIEKGFLLCLNLDCLPAQSSMFTGRTLPTMVLNRSFASWDEYIKSLRSPYRRRLIQIENKLSSFTITTTPCSEYTEEMHKLYLQVYHRSKDKLEKLSADFMRNLPADFALTRYEKDNKLYGWTISLHDDKNWFFFLGGRDYRISSSDNIYFCMLQMVLKQAINAGTQVIDFGQTAEIPKMRLGGKLHEKYMLGHHSNRFIHSILHKLSPLLSYTRQVPPVRIFQEDKL